MFTVQIEISEEEVLSYLPYINRFYCGVDDLPITIGEVRNKPDLLEYICTDITVVGMNHDPLEHVKNDGWCEVEDYR